MAGPGFHWNYFLAIEEDLVRLSRYVEFHPDNFGCYSIETARILLAAGAEVDVTCKRMCRVFEPESDADRMSGYRVVLLERFPDLAKFGVGVPRFGLSL